MDHLPCREKIVANIPCKCRKSVVSFRLIKYGKNNPFPFINESGFYMKLFDIVGPVMIGPSSSHTAGAVKIGLIARKLLGEKPVKAEILLHGSFAMTGSGHGTDRAIVAGIMGIRPDDERIPDSFDIAHAGGLSFSIDTTHIPNAHPNSTMIKLEGEQGRKLELVASSLGGGRIIVSRIDGITSHFSGDENTLIVHAQHDRPGHVARVTTALANHRINIATMQLHRQVKGGQAVMVIECDSIIPTELVDQLKQMEGIVKVTFLNHEN